MSFPDSIAYIIKELSTRKKVKPSDVVKIIGNAKVNSLDLEPWKDFNHPSTSSYGRKMIFKSSNFEIMVMSWAPGDMSAIHNHGYTTWGAVQVFGENEHATFRVEENKLITLSRENFKFGDIVGVGHNLIHQMGNLTDKPICSLHVYGVDENLENVTGDAYLYDVSNSSIQVINGGVFFDLPNSDIEDIIEGPIGDFPTQLRDLVEKGRRIRCSNPNSNKIEVIESKILSENFKNMLSNFLNGTNKHGLDLLKKEMEEANKFLSESKVEGRASLFATLYSF